MGLLEITIRILRLENTLMKMKTGRALMMSGFGLAVGGMAIVMMPIIVLAILMMMDMILVLCY